MALRGINGLREAEAGEFTRRALVNGRLDLTEAEGLADLLEAETEQQRRAALAVAGGALRREIEEWRSQLVDLSAQAEAAIDYVGDDNETQVDEQRVHRDAARLVEDWRDWLGRPPAELIHQGVRVVLAGPPNAGKSSLLNALVGQDRAIVTEVAGTTRDIIEVPLALGGFPLTLVDTAGLRDTTDVVERLGVTLARSQVSAADVLIWLGEVADCPDMPVVVLLHAQSDCRPPAPPGTMPVSARTGQGLPELRSRLIELARGISPASDALLLNRRQANALEMAVEALTPVPDDLVLMADCLRHARSALDQLTGRAGFEDVLDALFGRFCLGK